MRECVNSRNGDASIYQLARNRKADARETNAYGTIYEYKATDKTVV